MGERSNVPSDAVKAPAVSTVEKQPTTGGRTTGRPPEAGAGWVQSNIDEGTWSSLDHTVAWNGEQQQYNWTDLNGGQHSTTSRPADEEVQPRDKKPTEPTPPTTADGWIPTTGQASVLKHPTRTFYWDTKKHEYTWIDPEGKRHVGPNRPPDDQVKQDYSAADDDD